MTRTGLVPAVLVAALVLTGSSTDDDIGPDATSSSTATPSEEPTGAPIGAEAILIEQQITDARRHVGVVADTSVIGEQPFCSGGTSSGGSSGATITETFECPGGTLQIRFAPTQRSMVQGAQWTVVSGTGVFEGLRGGGSMVGRFSEENPDTGLVTFAGLVGK